MQKVKIIFSSIFIFSLFIGCGTQKAHKTFTKTGALEIHILNDLPKYVGLDNIMEPSYLIDLYGDEERAEFKSIQKYITLLFKHKGRAGGGSKQVGRVMIDLCKNKIFSKQDYYKQDKIIATFPAGYDSSIPQTILTTPSILKTKGFLDENNKIKDDICIYPGDNLLYDTMKKGDWIIIPKEEMNKALENYSEVLEK
jgi:hypothetical protein